MLIIENVEDFVSGDSVHEVFSSIIQYMCSMRMTLVGCWTLIHSQVGGCSNRKRVFPVWETIDMAASLPPLVTKLTQMEPPERGCLLSLLESIDSVCALQLPASCVFVPCPASDVDICNNQTGNPVVVGWVSLSGEGSLWMLGEAVWIRNDSRPWRIIGQSDHMLQLLYDLRAAPVFKWIHKSQLSEANRVSSRWKVFSIRGVAQSVRHTNFAPGDLYLDDRDPERCMVRPLSGLEKWRIAALSPAKAAWLAQQGQSDALGPLAGNSIPAEMASLVMQHELRRVSWYMSIKAARVTGLWVLMNSLPTLEAGGYNATLLLILDPLAASVAVSADGGIQGIVDSSCQKMHMPRRQDGPKGLGWTARLKLRSC